MFLMLDVSVIFSVIALIFLEGALSMDNALALAVTVRRLPANQQKKALIYGVWGAFLFRIVCVFFLGFILKWAAVKIIGGGYLLYLCLSHFMFPEPPTMHTKEASSFSFWRTVLIVELIDISFSIDSILASVAVSNALWVIVLGAILGIVMMRIAAGSFIALINKFPRLEVTAYLLIGVFGSKLILEGLAPDTFNFHVHGSMSSVLFWMACLFAVYFGFTKPQAKIRGCT